MSESWSLPCFLSFIIMSSICSFQQERQQYLLAEPHSRLAGDLIKACLSVPLLFLCAFDEDSFIMLPSRVYGKRCGISTNTMESYMAQRTLDTLFCSTPGLRQTVCTVMHRVETGVELCRYSLMLSWFRSTCCMHDLEGVEKVEGSRCHAKQM